MTAEEDPIVVELRKRNEAVGERIAVIERAIADLDNQRAVLIGNHKAMQIEVERNSKVLGLLQGHRCPECGESFGFANVLGRHRQLAHGVVGKFAKPKPKQATPAPAPSAPAAAKPVTTVAASVGDKVLACDGCDAEFGLDQTNALMRHTFAEHGRRATVNERTPVKRGAVVAS
jgi:uncharacterized C2H2 Zn-finger protein